MTKLPLDRRARAPKTPNRSLPEQELTGRGGRPLRPALNLRNGAGGGRR